MCNSSEGEATYFFDLQDITWNNIRSLDFLQFAITENSGLESEGLLELGDDGTGLVLLDETNKSVEEK